MDKYAELRTQGTNGINCGLETEDVIAQLQAWDTQYGIEVDEIHHDRLRVCFETLPEDGNLDLLVEQIYEFCPDIVDQGFGCIAEALEQAEEMPPETLASLQAQVEGIDLEDENYGLELLKRSLQREKELHLWWD